MSFRDGTSLGEAAGHVGPNGKMWVALAAFVCLGGASCAHEDAGPTSVSQLRRTVESLRAQNAAYEKQVEELQNRVFILNDQLENHKPAATDTVAPAVALPKVTLHPGDDKTTPPDETEPAAGSEAAVEYAGEAAKTASKRPVLRLYGDEMPVLSTRTDEPAPPAPVRRLVVTGEGAPRAEKPAAHAAAAELYRRSLEALRTGHHTEAAAGFREFLRLYANHEYADNAQYWLGECYYDQKDFPTAVREFRRVLEKYPQGNKVPDALLKVGFSHLALGSTEVGRQTLEQLIHTYPRHEAAGLASARLAELAHAGATAAALPKTESRSEHPGEEVP